MTADVDLLPLPEPTDVMVIRGAARRGFTAEQVTDYARANVAHATAAKDAEIEALRVERDTLERHLAAAMAEVANMDRAEAQAEQLAEALREAKRLGDQGDWRAEREVICTALRKYGHGNNDA